jgi:hypothetical protein
MHRAVARAIVVGLLLGGAAQADSGWREIRGPHVVLRTDLGSGAAREAALAVERFRAQIIAAGWPRATLPPADRIDVTVFGNGLDFEHHFSRNISGVFLHEVPPFAVMYGHPDKWEHRASLATPETTSILRHELVHHLAASIYRRQPRWFSEGLAQFLETVRTGEDGKTVVVGAANLDAMQKYRSFRSLRVADALAWSGQLDAMPEATVHGLYGLSCSQDRSRGCQRPRASRPARLDQGPGRHRPAAQHRSPRGWAGLDAPGGCASRRRSHP